MKIQPKPFERGAEITYKDATTIPADMPLRPLRDQVIVEPLESVYSAILEVIHEAKPMKGIIKAVGPGCYPKCYDHPDKHRRSKMWESKHFRHTQVHIGDIVELGGYQYGGYNFQTFYWGDKLHIICREADIAGIYHSEQENLMQIRPLYDRIVVKRLEAESISAGGLVIPDMAREKPDRGEVIAIGEGKLLENGEIKPLNVLLGDIVYFGKHIGNEIKTETDNLIVLREEDVLGVVNDCLPKGLESRATA